MRSACLPSVTALVILLTGLVALIAHVYGIITSGHEMRRGSVDDLLEEDLRDPINSVFNFLRVKFVFSSWNVGSRSVFITRCN